MRDQRRDKKNEPSLAGPLGPVCAALLAKQEAALEGAERWFYGGTPPSDAEVVPAPERADQHQLECAIPDL